MLSTLAEKIHDNRFLRLMRNMLKAGYLEDWVWNATLSGVPQGGVVSPVMSNIYLHRLDMFVETVLIPEYTRGRIRRQNTDYTRTQGAIQRARKRGDRVATRQLRKQLRGMPSGDPRDPGSAGCATPATPTTPCSGSPDRRPKPNRSNSASPVSCATTSSWNCPRTKH